MNHINLSLSNIINHLINEDSNLAGFKDTKDKINYAIDNQLMISLNYNDGKGNDGYNPAYGNPRGFRRIIPYCLGSRNGRLALRAFHAFKKHTKKGPFKWKFFYLDRMSNVRVYKNMHIPGIPALANPEGDKHMDKIINMIGMKKFVSPLERERQNTDLISQGKTNPVGPITKKGHVNSLSNLNYTPKENQPDYKAAKKNLQAFDKENTPDVRQQRWHDADKAEKERDDQIKQQQAPNPPTNNPGPVNQEELDGYEEYLNNNRSNI